MKRANVEGLMGTSRFLVVLAVVAACYEGGATRNAALPASPGGGDDPVQRGENPRQVAPVATGGSPLLTEVTAGCPTLVDGAQVDVVDQPGRVEILFTTQSGDVYDLRSRVRSLARVYEAGARGTADTAQTSFPDEAPGPFEGHLTNPGTGQGPRIRPIPAVASSVSNVEGGARIVLTPVDPSELEDLGQRVREHQELIRAGHCWMLQEADSDGSE
jgi:hypothetical protein